MHCCAWVAAEARVISASVALSSATFVRVEVVGIVAVLVRCAMGSARCVSRVEFRCDTRNRPKKATDPRGAPLGKRS